MRKAALFMVVLLLVMTAIVFLAPRFVEVVTVQRLDTTNHFIDSLWWPLTAARCGVYAGLAWLLYPLLRRRRWEQLQWQQQHHPLDDPRYAALDQRIHNIEQVRSQEKWIFLAFIGFDLVVAQFPYALLRGF